GTEPGGVRLREPRDDAEAAVQLDDAEAVRHGTPVARRPGRHRRVQPEPRRRTDAGLGAAVGGAVWARGAAREVEPAARRAAAGDEPRGVAVVDEEPVRDGPRRHASPRTNARTRPGRRRRRAASA